MSHGKRFDHGEKVDNFDTVAAELSDAVYAFRDLGFETYNEHAMPAIEIHDGTTEAEIKALINEFQADRKATFSVETGRSENKKTIVRISNQLYLDMKKTSSTSRGHGSHSRHQEDNRSTERSPHEEEVRIAFSELAQFLRGKKKELPSVRNKVHDVLDN